MSAETKETRIPGKWYVFDPFAHTRAELIVSGPHDTEAEAEADRKEWNCADDYQTRQWKPDTTAGA